MRFIFESSTRRGRLRGGLGWVRQGRQDRGEVGCCREVRHHERHLVRRERRKDEFLGGRSSEGTDGVDFIVGDRGVVQNKKRILNGEGRQYKT